MTARITTSAGRSLRRSASPIVDKVGNLRHAQQWLMPAGHGAWGSLVLTAPKKGTKSKREGRGHAVGAALAAGEGFATAAKAAPTAVPLHEVSPLNQGVN